MSKKKFEPDNGRYTVRYNKELSAKPIEDKLHCFLPLNIKFMKKQTVTTQIRNVYKESISGIKKILTLSSENDGAKINLINKILRETSIIVSDIDLQEKVKADSYTWTPHHARATYNIPAKTARKIKEHLKKK